PESGDREPVRAGERGADRRREAEADRLESLREAETLLVRNLEEHARVAHEVPRVDGDDALGGQEVVERDRQGARVDATVAGEIGERDVAPPQLGAEASPDRSRAVPPRRSGGVVRCRVDAREDGPGGDGDIADDTEGQLTVDPERVRGVVDLDDGCVRR